MAFRAQLGFPILLFSQDTQQQTGEFPGTLLEGGGAMGGRTLLRTLGPGTYLSHLDSNLGSGCFSFVNLSNLFNHSQL